MGNGELYVPLFLFFQDVKDLATVVKSAMQNDCSASTPLHDAGNRTDTAVRASNTPRSVLSCKPPLCTATPSRVAKQPGTPCRVMTPKMFTRCTMLRPAHTPVTPPSRVIRETHRDQGLGTPRRVPKSDSCAQTPNQTPKIKTPCVEDSPDNKENVESIDSTTPELSNASVKFSGKNGKPDTNGNQDIRKFWKTKKTPNKSPVLKEVLTTEVICSVIDLKQLDKVIAWI